MSPTMQIIDTGVLGRGEPGTARATLTFPSAVSLSNGVVLAAYRAGTGKDTDDEAIEVCRSTDNGRTWSAPRRAFESPSINGLHGSIKLCYFTEIEPGHLLAGALWVDRETHAEQPLFNPDTEGCLPMAVILADSFDHGETWSAWREVPMPHDIGPPSLTNPVLALKGGTLALSIETNKTYHDRSKWYQRAVFRHSTDRGQTWGEPINAGFDPTGRIRNWDQRVGVSPDGEVATFLWTYDTATKAYLNIRRRISKDGGRTWSEAQDLGFTDQASHPAVLPDGRAVLAWVDRFKTQTIRARLAPSIDGAFAAETEVVVHTQSRASADDVDASGALGGSVWSFGLPYAEVMPDGDVLVLYYAGTEAAMDVRWARLKI